MGVPAGELAQLVQRDLGRLALRHHVEMTEDEIDTIENDSSSTILTGLSISSNGVLTAMDSSTISFGQQSNSASFSGYISHLSSQTKTIFIKNKDGYWPKGNVTVKEYGTREVIFEDVLLKDGEDRVKQSFDPGEKLVIEMHYMAKTSVSDPVFGFNISDQTEKNIIGTNTSLRPSNIGVIKGKGIIRAEIGSLNLQRGVYHISVACHSADHKTQYHRKDNFLDLKINLASEDDGMVFMPVTFEKKVISEK